ncbi:repressor of RNA polymerase III transcription [Haematococcus lacustris]|uniref:Repressor of RNA polymerase III transcription n=1 Tax=Haematococcus lacustris TaxID=44745 RepID=A0A699ZWN5_HAELA|nr:repressor of RNA polymerase III transcription [Haematococcus lacustris]
MKFLDLPPLARITSFLDHVDVGDYVVEGKLEAYSCKLAGLDKKLSKSLEQEVQTGSSPLELSASPVGPLSESACRKTLIYLILTLSPSTLCMQNNVYSDHDFSSLRAHHFKKEAGVTRAEETIDSHLLEVSKVWTKTPGVGEQPFLESLWSSIDEVGLLLPRLVDGLGSALACCKILPQSALCSPTGWQFSGNCTIKANAIYSAI